ncbi:MAG TPA: helix-turn-helix domain-containing protein [Pseudonocardiaceae bacterium]|nr:helix-turn-helix domain-containing protein [Pseudonocardiaceae bacterium]
MPPKHRVTDLRERLTPDVVRSYEMGVSIRECAELHGISYGTAHRILAESGVQLRPWGAAPAVTAIEPVKDGWTPQ